MGGGEWVGGWWAGGREATWQYYIGCSRGKFWVYHDDEERAEGDGFAAAGLACQCYQDILHLSRKFYRIASARAAVAAASRPEDSNDDCIIFVTRPHAPRYTMPAHTPHTLGF